MIGMYELVANRTGIYPQLFWWEYHAQLVEIFLLCFLFFGVDFPTFVSDIAHVLKTPVYCMTCSSSSRIC